MDWACFWVVHSRTVLGADSVVQWSERDVKVSSSQAEVDMSIIPDSNCFTFLEGKKDNLWGKAPCALIVICIDACTDATRGFASVLQLRSPFYGWIKFTSPLLQVKVTNHFNPAHHTQCLGSVTYLAERERSNICKWLSFPLNPLTWWPISSFIQSSSVNSVHDIPSPVHIRYQIVCYC